MKFKKYIAYAISLAMCISAVGCGNSNDSNSVDSTADVESSSVSEVSTDLVGDVIYTEMGLGFSVPDNWETDENVNILVENLTSPSNDIYSFLEYSYAPDENMEEVNNPESTVSIYDLSAPVFVFFVVKDENLHLPTVQNSFKIYDTVHELEKQGVFNFYFMTDYNDIPEDFSPEALEKYKEVVEEGYAVLDTITTSRPDEDSTLARIEDGQQYLAFDSKTLYGTPKNTGDFLTKDVTVLNFFGTYAYPDINEFKELEAFYQEIRKNYPNVAFNQVIIDLPDAEAEAKIKEIYKDEDITFEGIIPDENLANWCVDHLMGLPTTVFVDSEGKIHGTVIEGKKTADHYISKLDYVLSDILGTELVVDNTTPEENNVDIVVE